MRTRNAIHVSIRFHTFCFPFYSRWLSIVLTRSGLKCNNLNIEIRPSDTPENTNASHKAKWALIESFFLNLFDIPCTLGSVHLWLL